MQHARFKLPPDVLEEANGDNPAERVLFYKKRELDQEVQLLTPDEIRARVYNLKINVIALLGLYR